MVHLPTIVKATSPEPQRNARGRDSSPPLSEGPALAREYVLIEEIGVGGTSKVYRAQSMDGRDVAVKLATGAVASKISEAHACSLIRRETIALEKADHDSIISLIDSGVFDGKRFMVTELLEGVGMRDYLAVRGALAFKDAKPHLLSICKAVSSLHNLGIIHCDLKPDNMKVITGHDGTETIKIFDFGFVKFKHEGEICTDRCGPFNRLGTPNYMPREQILGNTFDHRVDIYAVGTIMYQMLCGNLPFESMNPREVLDMQINKMPEDPRTRRPELNIPWGVNAIVMRALRKRMEERFQTMDEMAKTIDNWQA